MRFRLHTRPGRRQTVGEMLYDIAQTQVAEMGLPARAIGLWFPYVSVADALHLGRSTCWASCRCR